MRLPEPAHTSRPWRIHELTPDFRVEDVWALPTPGGPGDFPLLVRTFCSEGASRDDSRAARALWAIRWRLGQLLGWDGPDAGLGSRVATLRDRLPEDLRNAPSGPDLRRLPFTPLYLLGDEYAAEIANRTMHGVLHLGWVRGQADGYRGQMAVLVKPNGPLGAFYMAAIRPFRYLIVYPAMLRQIERDWRSLDLAEGAAGARLARLIACCTRVARGASHPRSGPGRRARVRVVRRHSVRRNSAIISASLLGRSRRISSTPPA
jgi:Protein of unknown function (DUF2867)